MMSTLSSVTYPDYLQLDKILDAQEPLGSPALGAAVYAAAMRDYVSGLDMDLVGFIHLQEMSRSS